MTRFEMSHLRCSFGLSIVIIFMLLRAAHAEEITTKQHFVFVPGVGHGAWAFAQVVTTLEDAGYSAVAVDLASQGISKLKASEVRTIQEYVRPLDEILRTSINNSVILVGHSLGGGSASVMMQRYPEKISKAVFLTSIMPTNNQTFFSALPPTVLPRLIREKWVIPSGNPPTSISINISASVTFLYNRSPRLAFNLASTLLNPSPYRPGEEPIRLTPENYGRIRRFYIRTGSDLAIRPDEQTQIITANAPEKVYTLPLSDHAPYFSQPFALCDILLNIARSPSAGDDQPTVHSQK